MKARTALLFAFLLSGQVLAQSGLRLPTTREPGPDPGHAPVPRPAGGGLEPGSARGWRAADYDRFGTALHNWREAVGFAPGQRMQWTYTLSDRSSLGMGMQNSRDLE